MLTVSALLLRMLVDGVELFNFSPDLFYFPFLNAAAVGTRIKSFLLSFYLHRMSHTKITSFKTKRLINAYGPEAECSSITHSWIPLITLTLHSWQRHWVEIKRSRKSQSLLSVAIMPAKAPGVMCTAWPGMTDVCFFNLFNFFFYN